MLLALHTWDSQRFAAYVIKRCILEEDHHAGKPEQELSLYVGSFVRKVPLGKELSRKGAKAQSATAFLKGFFAPLRLCARKMFGQRSPQVI